MVRVSIVLLCAFFASYAFATEVAVVATQTGDGKEVATEAKKKEGPSEPVSVRIGLLLTSYQKLVTIKEGKRLVRHQPMKELRHTLRSRLNKKNHFFVGDYHIESRPMAWDRENQRYAVRMTISRRYGAFGQLEEVVGSVDVHGVLGDRQGNVFVLYGSAKKRFRDKFGNPVLDVIAGYKPAPRKTAEQAKPKQKAEAPRVRRLPRKTALPPPGRQRKRF